MVKEHPQPVAVLQQFLKGARGFLVTISQPSKQQSFDLGEYGDQHPFQPGAGEELIAVLMRLLE